MTGSAFRVSTPESTVSPVPVRPIDLVHLAKQSLGDKALEIEVLHMFDSVLALQFSRIQSALSKGEVAAGLHALKGSAAGVGATGVHAQAAEAEVEFFAQGRISDERLADLDLVVSETRAFISELVAD